MGSRSRRRGGLPPRGGGARPANRRLRLEPLEDRCLLAAELFDPPRLETLGDGGSAATSAPTHSDGDTHLAGPVAMPAQHHLVNTSGFLSAPSPDDPLEIAVRFLKSHAGELGLSAEDLREYKVVDRFQTSHNGVKHLHLRQTFHGLEVVNADINVNLTAAGEVINVGSSFLPGLSDPGRGLLAGPQLAIEQAFSSLAADLGWDDDAAQVAERSAGLSWTTLLQAPEVAEGLARANLQYVPQAGGGVALAWKMNVKTPDGDHWYDASVSTHTGQLLNLADWGSPATYRVFASPKMSPASGPRSMETDPHLTALNASPAGWHDNDGVAGAEFTITRGNNVFAYADTNNDNQPDAAIPDGGEDLTFSYSLSLAQQPSAYQEAAITNLFYWTNLLHDIHYQYGFDEAAGNFQDNNFGHGGVGNDYVLAEAQDGQELNNANFFTPPDGQNGRMQVYLWDTTNPQIDGDLDSGVIIHEYGHGISTRLTGGPGNSNSLTTLQSRGLGEGWSDWYALMLTQTAAHSALESRGIGTYMLGQPSTARGIRTVPYSYNMSLDGLTFREIADLVDPHDIGEVWASVLWDLNWLLIEGNRLDSLLPAGMGFDADYYYGEGGNNLALQLVMDAMKLQPSNPSFLDARDAILTADQINNNGANQLAIWRAFARRGMGFSATDGGNSSSLNVTEAFDLPANFAGTVEFGAEAYQVEETVQIVVRDLHLQDASLTVAVSSDGGDAESVALSRTGLGTYQGSIATAPSPGAVGDGVLDVADGDRITVTYNDENDGTSTPVQVQDTAEIFVINIVGGDLHYLELRAGDSVHLFTETPAPPDPNDLLDVAVSVYSPLGDPLFSDDNSAPDGRNAQLDFVAPTAGRYIIQVVELAGVGEYALHTDVVPAGVVLEFTSDTGSFHLTPGERIRVTARIAGSPEDISGFQLNFVNSNVNHGQLVLENWETSPSWFAIDGGLNTPLDTFVAGANFSRVSPPVTLGSFDLVAPDVAGSFVLSVDYAAQTAEDTGFVTILGPLDVVEYGAITVVVVETPPSGVLRQPAENLPTSVDLGYVDIRWESAGAIDVSTLDIADILLHSQGNPLTIDRVEPRGGGVWRYFYADDGDALSEGDAQVTLVAGQVAAVSGVLNQADSAWFVFDATAPQIVSIRINDQMTDPPDLPSGTQPTSWVAQRSDIRDITVEFSEPIVATAGDLQLTNLGLNAPQDADEIVTLAPGQVTVDDHRLTLRFESYELADGVYQLELRNTIADAAGLPLDGDADGVGGDAFAYVGSVDNRFYKMAAEFNGDGGVSIFDFPAFAYWFGVAAAAAPEYLDLNGDGGISIFDFAPFAANFGSGPVFPDALASPPAPLWSPQVLVASEESSDESSSEPAVKAAVPAIGEPLPSAPSNARSARDVSARQEVAAQRQDETLEDLLNRLQRAPEWYRNQWSIPWLR